jgi:transposase-like protein
MAADCGSLPSLLHTWLQKMEESSEGLPSGLARRAKAAVAGQLREDEKKARTRADELSRLAAALEGADEVSPKEPVD